MSFANISDWNQLLVNKVVFIAGAGGHIAKYIAKTCYAQGARLVLGDLDLTFMNELVNELANNADRVLMVRLDITNETSIQQAIQTAIDKWQTVDVLLNLAALFQYGSIEETSAEAWTRVFDVNVRGYALMAKHLIPLLKKQNHGVIVNFASNLALIACPDMSPYSASKAAVLQLTRNLALDLGSYNVRVNSISPSLVNVPSMREHAGKIGLTTEIMKDICVSASCIKRLLEPQEIANLVVFLASDLCSFMTGTNLILDGGGIIK